MNYLKSKSSSSTLAYRKFRSKCSKTKIAKRMLFLTISIDIGEVFKNPHTFRDGLDLEFAVSKKEFIGLIRKHLVVKERFVRMCRLCPGRDEKEIIRALEKEKRFIDKNSIGDYYYCTEIPGLGIECPKGLR